MIVLKLTTIDGLTKLIDVQGVIKRLVLCSEFLNAIVRMEPAK